MEDKFKGGGITINISGGNNQILPHATQATQNFYGDHIADDEFRLLTSKGSEAPQSSEMSEAAVRLRRYVDSDERLKTYLAEIRLCGSATELAQVIVSMQHQEPRITKEEITKERFISIVKALAPDVKKGNTVSNIRARINDALQRKER